MAIIDYRYSQDKEGYYHEVLRNGTISPRKFKKRHNLEGWIRTKFRLTLLGSLIFVCIVIAIIGKIFDSI